MKYLILLALTLLTGCVGPMTYRQTKLPNGTIVRAYQAGSLFAPGISFVAVCETGQTNWTLPQTFSGPSVVASASTGAGIATAGALIRPDTVHLNTNGGASSSRLDPTTRVQSPPMGHGKMTDHGED